MKLHETTQILQDPSIRFEYILQARQDKQRAATFFPQLCWSGKMPLLALRGTHCKNLFVLCGSAQICAAWAALHLLMPPPTLLVLPPTLLGTLLLSPTLLATLLPISPAPLATLLLAPTLPLIVLLLLPWIIICRSCSRSRCRCRCRCRRSWCSRRSWCIRRSCSICRKHTGRRIRHGLGSRGSLGRLELWELLKGRKQQRRKRLWLRILLPSLATFPRSNFETFAFAFACCCRLENLTRLMSKLGQLHVTGVLQSHAAIFVGLHVRLLDAAEQA